MHGPQFNPSEYVRGWMGSAEGMGSLPGGRGHGPVCVPGRRASQLAHLITVVLLTSCALPARSEPVERTFLEEANEINHWIVGVRRDLHKIPERLFQLHKTSAYVRKTLDDLEIPYRCVASAVDRSIWEERGGACPQCRTRGLPR